MILVDTRRGGALTGPVPDYERIVWAEQVNAVTGGTITLPRSSPALETLLAASGTAELVGLLITDETGWRTSCHVTAEGFTATERLVTVPFRVDTAILNEIPAFPDPATPATPWASNSYWTYTAAPAVTVCAEFIASHGGPTSHTDWRRFDQISTFGTGPTVTFRARMEPSLDYLAAKVAGTVVISTYLAGGQSYVGIRSRSDLPGVVFSADLNTIADFTFANSMPPANVAFAGGAGDGTARQIATSTSPAAMWPRKRGMFIDRGSSTGADLQAAANDAVAWEGPTLTLTATDAPGTAYGLDWLLGDMVRADVLGQRFTLPATAVTTEATPGRVKRTVTLGAPRLEGRELLALKREFITRYGLQENH